MTEQEGLPPSAAAGAREGAPAPGETTPSPSAGSTPDPNADTTVIAANVLPRPARDPNQPLQIFISYRREDSSGQAGRLYDSLSDEFGHENVFIDLDAIGPGEDFADVIDQALQRCDVVLVVIGPRWLSLEREGVRRLDDPNDYLRIEIEHSLARAPRVIPVLVQDAEMPTSRDLPDPIKNLARRNAFELSDSRWRLDVARLIDALEGVEQTLGIAPGARAAARSGAKTVAFPAVTGTPTRHAPPPIPPTTVHPSTASDGGGGRRSQTGLIALVALIVALIVVAVGAFVLAQGGPSPTPTPKASPTLSATTEPTASPSLPTLAPTSSPSPSPAPSPSPSPSPTAAPTPSPTAPPTPSPTPAPTAAPTPTLTATPVPTPSPTPEPTVEPPPALPAGIGLGAATLELNEDFSKPGSFPTGTTKQGTYGYKNGAYQIKVTDPSSSVWSPHVMAKAHPVVSIRGTVTAPTAGTFGALYCGNAAGDFLYGGVEPDNVWIIGQLVESTFSILDSGDIPADALPAAGHDDQVRFDCAVTGGANDRVQLSVGGVKLGDRSDASRVGPFTSAGLLGSSGTEPPDTITFDTVVIRTGEQFQEAPEALRSHVPSAWAKNCSPVQEDGTIGQIAALICTPAGTIDQAEYYQYDSAALMQTEWESEVSAQGDNVPGTDCSKGPSLGTYKDASGSTAGSLMCHPNHGSMGGLIYIWTNDQLRIISAGISTTGTYSDMADWWVNAGPLP